jgi:ABC-type lipoprotein release transport system permease subunit
MFSRTRADRSALFLVVAVLACVLPARTAISVNPVEALGAE